MKSKPIGTLFGVLTLVAILAIAPSAFADTAQVTITAGAGASANAPCVAAKNCFSPNPVQVGPGGTVTWTNPDTTSHTVTSGDPSAGPDGNFDSGLIIGGKSFTYTFNSTQVGNFNYFCQIHPWMTGQVIVGAAATSSGNMTGMSGNMTGMSGNMSSTSGNQAVPEFGPIASLVLVFAVVGAVIMSARTRGFLKL